MRNKYSQKEISQKLSERGFILKSDYQHARADILTVCPCGNEYITTWNLIQRGRKCNKCRYIRSAKSKTNKFEKVKRFFIDKQCILLSHKEDYINNESPLLFQCKCGKVFPTTLTRFQAISGCKSCSKLGSNNPSYNPDREYIKFSSKIRASYKTLIRRILKCKKHSKSEDILGYSRKNLIDHITASPNWNQIKNQKWHIDHIYPIKAFLENYITDPRLINCLENLRPYLASENLKKNAKYNKEEFLIWLQAISKKYGFSKS